MAYNNLNDEAIRKLAENVYPSNVYEQSFEVETRRKHWQEGFKAALQQSNWTDSDMKALWDIAKDYFLNVNVKNPDLVFHESLKVIRKSKDNTKAWHQKPEPIDPVDPPDIENDIEVA